MALTGECCTHVAGRRAGRNRWLEPARLHIVSAGDRALLAPGGARSVRQGRRPETRLPMMADACRRPVVTAGERISGVNFLVSLKHQLTHGSLLAEVARKYRPVTFSDRYLVLAGIRWVACG